MAQWPGYPTSDVPKNPDGKPNFAAATPRTPDGKPDLLGIWEFRGGGHGGASGRGVGFPSCSLAACAAELKNWKLLIPGSHRRPSLNVGFRRGRVCHPVLRWFCGASNICLTAKKSPAVGSQKKPWPKIRLVVLRSNTRRMVKGAFVTSSLGFRADTCESNGSGRRGGSNDRL